MAKSFYINGIGITAENVDKYSIEELLTEFYKNQDIEIRRLIRESLTGRRITVVGGKYNGRSGSIKRLCSDVFNDRIYVTFDKISRERTTKVEMVEWQFVLAEIEITPFDNNSIRACRKCGCTEDKACIDEHGQPCYWVSADLCSACFTHKDDLKPAVVIPDQVTIIGNPELSIPSEPKSNNKMKKIVIPTSPLLAVLKKVKEVIDKKPTLSLLENILIKVRRTDIQIIATDLMVTVIADIEVSNDFDYGYEFLLPFKFFHDFMVQVNDTAITLEYIEKTKKEDGKKVIYPQAKITTFADTIDIDWLDKTDDWPKLPEFPHENSVGIGDGFIDWLNLMVDTVSDDKSRPSMQRISIAIANNGITMASTNAYVLVEKSFQCESQHTIEMLVNTKIAKALKGFKETSISWSPSHIAFVSSNMTLIGTIQDEKYPDYKGLFGSAEPNFNVSLTELTGVMDKVSLTEKFADIYFKREIGHIVVDSFDQDYNRRITVRIAADYTGECEKITINPKELLRLLGQVKYLNLSLSITEFNRPIIITTESDETYRSLIMPIQA